MNTTEQVEEPRTLVGSVWYTSWGYDQTNVEFLRIEALSLTGKTGLCKMMSKKHPLQKVPRVDGHGVLRMMEEEDGSHVLPDKVYDGCGVFRMKIDKRSSGDPCVKGSYPFCNESEPRRFDYFWLWDGKPVYETPAGFGQ